MRFLPRRKRTWVVILASGTVMVATLVILMQPRARAALRLVRGFSALNSALEFGLSLELKTWPQPLLLCQQRLLA